MSLRADTWIHAIAALIDCEVRRSTCPADVVAIAVLISPLKGYLVSLAGDYRRVDCQWKRVLSFARSDLYWIQKSMIATGLTLLLKMPIPLQALQLCIPSR